MKKKVLALLTTMAIFSTSLFAINAYAYALWPGGYNSQNVDADGTTYVSSSVISYVQTAATSWQNKGSHRAINLSSTSANKIKVVTLSDTYMGKYIPLELASPIYVTNRVTKFEIQLNSNITNNYFNTVGTTTHELGHSVGLDDNPNATAYNPSIMSWSRDRLAIYSPQIDDITGVNTYY